MVGRTRKQRRPRMGSCVAAKGDISRKYSCVSGESSQIMFDCNTPHNAPEFIYNQLKVFTIITIVSIIIIIIITQSNNSLQYFIWHAGPLRAQVAGVSHWCTKPPSPALWFTPALSLWNPPRPSNPIPPTSRTHVPSPILPLLPPRWLPH